MEGSRTISVSIPFVQFEAIEKLAQKENRTVDEIVQDALRWYEGQYNQREPKTFAEAVRMLQEDAKVKGVNKMTMEEIDAEIAAVRQEQLEKESAKRMA